MSDCVQISTFYQFFDLNPQQVGEIKEELEALAEKNQLKGLVILGAEGFNATVAGSLEAIQNLKNYVTDTLEKYKAPPTVFKDSESHFVPFKIFKVKVREEIVTLGDKEVLPEDLDDATHLSPEEWDLLLQDPNSICIDTRNWYENEMGMFEGAIDPKIETFQEFHKFVENENFDKDKNIMLYCTGGIRCEKAVPDLLKLGYRKVFQLKGGILNYLQERPNQSFKGECFVFDNRVAVDQELKPSEKFKLCPHCGQPAEEKIECRRCDTVALVCQRCLDKDISYTSCSKNCAYQLRLHPDRKGKRQVQGYRVKVQSLENKKSS